MLQHILRNGVKKGDRTGTGTTSVFGYQERFDLQAGFPLLTTKKIHFKSVVEELLWMISGSTNIKPLQEKGVTIWDEWADESGELGPVYGKQWREWETNEYDGFTSEGPDPAGNNIKRRTIDQLANVIERIKTKPDCRRLIVTAWNPADIDSMKLPPCHAFFQFYVANRKLSCHMYQRSADAFLGVPFNIASYALLTHLVAQVTGLGVGEFVHSFGDLHIYNNHLEQVAEQLSRTPTTLPSLQIVDKAIYSIDDFRGEHFGLVGYDPHPAIKAPVAV